MLESFRIKLFLISEIIFDLRNAQILDHVSILSALDGTESFYIYQIALEWRVSTEDLQDVPLTASAATAPISTTTTT